MRLYRPVSTAQPQRAALTLASVVAAFAIGWPTVASASFLGHEIRYEYLYPDASTAFESATFTVGAGPEFVTGTSGQTQIDFDAFSIQIGPNQGVSSGQTLYYSPNGNSFNGFGFSDQGGTLPAILSASFNLSSTVAGLTPEMISVTPDSILINLRGVYAETDDLIDVDVVFVPEPSSGVLMLAGLIHLAGRRRRSRGPVRSFSSDAGLRRSSEV